MDTRIAKIYLITNNINGKNYIGYTRKSVQNRFNDHCKNSTNSVIGKAIKKYGRDNFSLEEIYCSKDQEHCLKVMESYFIELYGSYKYGYNATKGGEGILGFSQDPAIIKRIADIRRGSKHRQETIALMKQTRKGSDNSCSKLTELDVINIRAIYEYCPTATTYKLAEIYKVSRRTIVRALKGLSWKHVVSPSPFSKLNKYR